MKFITCASYYGTGSSAIIDLFSEFENTYSFGNDEFRFIHDPDGIRDLEYNLVENFNRHNSGHAIKRYIKLIDFYSSSFYGAKYEKLFDNNWKSKSLEYINSLTDFTYKGWWQYDLLDKGKVYYFRKRFINKILQMTIWKNKPERTLNTMKNEITYCSQPTEEEFLYKTKKYIENLFSDYAKDNKCIVADQLVPPTNLNKYIRYFNDIKIVVVDRDPRDIYLLEKYVWKDGIIPSEVEEFCKWFKYTRKHRDVDNLDTDNIKFVQFENLIYKYEETVLDLINWVGFNNKKHINKFKSLDPRKSINNTKLWKKIDCNKEEINYIEENLNKYLYKYYQ
ncbi:MAG: hypothetical protein WBH68_03045 [Erysipelotrichaceae bacterium]